MINGAVALSSAKKAGLSEKRIARLLLSWYNLIAEKPTLKARIVYHNER